MAISGSDLFVSNAGNGLPSNGTIGEYTTSGLTVNSSLISGFTYPWGIAISGNDTFVSVFIAGTVSEYTTAGGTVNASLISGLNEPYGIAVSSVPEPSVGRLAGLSTAVLWLLRRRKLRVAATAYDICAIL